MKKEKKIALNIIVRYSLLFLSALFMSAFYKIFLPLTIYPVFFILNLFYNPLLLGDLILVNSLSIKIISACVAGSAYFLLLALNLTTDMKLKKRILSILFSFSVFLIINILRILILSLMLIKNIVYFEMVHKIFWYTLSILFVVCIWFLTVYLFKIKNIPAYTDIKQLLRQSKK